MPGPGFGFGHRFGLRYTGQQSSAPGVAVVAPSASWTGVAGSGFAGADLAAITDPVRVTAKPVCRLLTVPNQTFSDQLLVGVFAGANNQDSLIDRMGLEKVVFRFEGGATEVLQPSFQTFMDANGSPVTYYGWWCWLQKPAQVAGEARLYIEAVPQDGTMQRRVIGPYSFFPRTTLHDTVIQIAATPPEQPGSRYRTISAALAFVAMQSFQNPVLRFTESGTYLFGTGGNAIPSWLNYECAPGVEVTLVGPANPTFEDATSTGKGRVTINSMSRFKGSGITLDFGEFLELYVLGTNGRWPWFDGCRITDSRGADTPWRGRSKAGFLGWAIRGNCWFTECEIDNLFNCPDSAELVRGCYIHNCYNDVFNDALCVVGNRLEEIDSMFFNTERLAMTVSYTGPEATASIQRTSAVGGVRIAWGANQATLPLSSTHAAYLANTNYTVRNVVDFINSYAAQGWSATLHDDVFFASALGRIGTKGATFTATSVKSGPLSLYTRFDIHGDLYQRANTGTLENVAFAFNTGFGLVTQNLFLVGAMDDVLVLNNAFHNKTGFVESENLRSQLNRVHRHVVIAHNTLATQDLTLRNDAPQTYNPDAYCLISSNSLKRVLWQGGVADSDLVIARTHQHEATLPALGSTGTTIGGDHVSLYVDAASGDFTPAGALLTNLSAPILRFGLNLGQRSVLAPAGAL